MKKVRRIIVFLSLACLFFTAGYSLLACSNDKQANTVYKIEAVYDETNKRIDGLMTVTYFNSYDAVLDNIVFHLYPRAYRQGAKFSPIHATDTTKAYPNGVSYGDITILNLKRDGAEQQIRLAGEDSDILEVAANLAPNTQTTIELDFVLELPNVRHRLGHFDSIANLGNWFPIICAYKNGAFCTTPYYSNGDPFHTEAANFEVQITTDKNLTVATSGVQSATISGDKKITTAKIENARDFAAIIGAFNTQNKTHNGVEINYYYVSDENAAKAIQTACDSLDTFNELFGKYAYNSLAVVKTPFLHAGMEYPALIYVSDAIAESSATEVIVHEIAHQWWYAAVGSDQVNDPWLDEGLTEYSTTLFFENNPSYGITYESRLADTLASYLFYIEFFKDNGRGDTSMNRSVYDYSTQTEYTIMTYVKGQLMFDALRKLIGKENFLNGIKSYYKDNCFKIATPDMLYGAMENASATNLQGFFSGWIEGKVKMYAS